MDSPRPTAAAVGSLSLGIVLMATTLVLGAGLLWKQPCASGDWADGRQYRPPRICYSDVVPLYGTEHLQGGRLPYLDPCPAGSGQCDEYPVLTMYFMRLAAWLGHGYAGFFYANALLLSLCALLTAWFLHQLTGPRALFFGLAPTLLVYAFVNWDLLAVALATAGTFAYLRNRDSAGGALLGLGAAAKLYPAFLVIPFVLERLRRRRTGEAGRLVVWAVVAYAAVNIPFALVAHDSWTTFFRFNANRVADWDSLWFVVCQRLHGGTGCAWSPHLLDTLSVVVFAVVSAGLYAARRALRPAFPRWTFGFPLVAVFLLSNKVYSPQYGLWLLPWFALTLPSPWLFGAFELADLAVFFTRFTWFGRLAAETGSGSFTGFHGAPLGAFEAAVVVRAVVLLACVIAWTVRDPDPLPSVAGGRHRRALSEAPA